jgi:hypothetical protein
VRAPIDSPELAEFVAALEPVNLDNRGPTREAFTFRSRLPAPAGVV